jgi:type I restriction enzyme M protein
LGGAAAQNIESAEITKTAIDLNNDLNDYSIAEYERCTLISAILLALQNKAFKSSYKSVATSKTLTPTPERVAKALIAGIASVLEDNDIDALRVKSMIGEYTKIKNHPIAKSEKIKKKKAAAEEPNYVLRDLTERLEASILPLISMGEKGYDVLGRFYREFIRYAGTDQKTGLVLTPQHITEFFGEVVNLNVNDVVYDSCCGTGGFLIASMKRMLGIAGNDAKKKADIKKDQLVGIEKRTDMFTFACSNMMMSGDGKSHIYQGDSFSPDMVALVKTLKPTVAFLNPPYDVGEDGQLEFVENALSCLQPGSRCVAVVQMSCATSLGAASVLVRERLLKSHKLTGVFSMPDDLFHPVGVITCIMAFEAHSPHPAGYKTFFGYFKDDGFRKTKNIGRVNQGQWNTIKGEWLTAYLNRESKAGLSVLQAVSASDEWCAEAYMETDYSKVGQGDFGKAVRDYAAYRLLHSEVPKADEKPLKFEEWGDFRYDAIFQIKKGKRLTKANMKEGTTPFIGAIDSNNGYRQFVSVEPNHPGNTITVNYNGNGVAEAFYQPQPYWASDDVNILYPKFELTPHIALFLCTLIRQEKFRFSYGRKWHLGRMNEAIIKLPTTPEGQPDWAFMESYVKALPFSVNV